MQSFHSTTWVMKRDYSFICFLLNFFLKPPPNNCIFPSILITSSKCISEEVLQPVIKCGGPSAQPNWFPGAGSSRLRPEDGRLCRNRCQRPESPEEAAGIERCAGRSQLLRLLARLPPHLPLRSRPALAPHACSPARLPAHSRSGAASVSSPEPLLGPGHAGGGWVCWVCWLCRESRGDDMRGQRLLIINHRGRRLVPCARWYAPCALGSSCTIAGSAAPRGSEGERKQRETTQKLSSWTVLKRGREVPWCLPPRNVLIFKTLHQTHTKQELVWYYYPHSMKVLLTSTWILSRWR